VSERRSQPIAGDVSRTRGASLGSAAAPRAPRPVVPGMLLALAVGALLALGTPAQVRAQSIPVSVGRAMSAPLGSAIDVPIIVDMSQRTEKLGSFALRIAWDPAVLGFDGGVSGSFGSVTVSEDSAAQGVLHLAGANPAGVGGVVTLGVGHFTVLSAASSPFTLTLTELFAAGAPFADLLPNAVVTSGAFCAAQGRYGDLDNNGLANSFDALVALSNAVGLDVSAYNIALGDVDANGATNARDALIILSSAVGLDVSGYRVLQVAGGACTTGTLGVIALSPSAVGSLLVGQTVGFEARGQGTGGLETLTDVAWSSSNAGVLQVAADGGATALAAGSADVIAVRDGRDTARVTVAVVARRTLHVVDAAAANSPNRIGTLELPFATIGDATAIAQDGDTIEARPGRYPENVELDVDALLLGDTLADGTRPVIAPSQGQGGGGVFLGGPGQRRITNLAFRDLVTAVDVEGPSRLELIGVRASNVWYGVTVGQNMSALIIRRSALTGPGQNGASGDGVSAYGAIIDTVLVEDTEIGDFDGRGIDLGEFGWVTVQRSHLRDLNYNAVDAGNSETRSGTALLLQNRIERIQGAFVNIGEADTVRLRGNLVTGGYCGDCIQVNSLRLLAMTGDSVESGPDDDDWLDAYDVDSVAIDSLHASVGDAVGYLYYDPRVTVTNSRLHNVSGTALEVYGYYGAQLVVDSVTISGNPSCQGCGMGIYTLNTRAAVSRLGVTSLGWGIENHGDSSVSVTHSVFRNTETAVSWNGNYVQPGSLTVTYSTFADFSDAGVALSYGGAVVDSNTFVAGQYATAVTLTAAEPMSVTRNRISGGYYGIDIEAQDSGRTHTVADNVVSTAYTPVDLTGDYSAPSALGLRFSAQRNSVTCGEAGAYGILVSEASAAVSDNVVQGCDGAIRLTATNYDPLATRADTVVRNTVQMTPNGTAGITVIENIRSVVSGNAITGDTTGNPYSYGAIWVGAYSTCVSYTCQINARIDSNTVTGVAGLGIQVGGADTVSLRGNTVNDVPQRGSGPFNGVGIAMYGAFRGAVRLDGDAVRRAARAGVWFNNSDTATLQVDSSLFNSNLVGIEIPQGGAILTRNRIANSDTGVVYGPSAYGSFTNNNIVGNRRMGVVSEESAINGANNWWGNPLGPRCVGACDPASTGDSIPPYGVLFDPPLTSEYGATPPLSAPPPQRVLAAVRAAPASALANVLTPARAAAERPAGSRRLPAARTPRVIATPGPVALPNGLSPAVAQRLGALLARHAQAVAKGAEVSDAARARLQAAAQAREASEQAASERRATRGRERDQQRRAVTPPAEPARQP